ncbi:OsmC family protein [Microvirga sp. 2YAF29]|uniref:OsmC family protein n=1 Tax=Microvirga sp. 2YAF29 TaxID=3233031 RepID=UPI003F953403
MTVMNVKLRSIPGTQASIGWAGAHSIVVDRPDGKAGGQGLGFNGGQLLALAIGGCFCNDLHYVAHEMGIELRSVSVDVSLTLDGAPLLATSAALQVSVEAASDDVDIAALIKRAEETSTISSSLRQGVPVTVSSALPP